MGGPIATVKFLDLPFALEERKGYISRVIHVFPLPHPWVPASSLHSTDPTEMIMRVSVVAQRSLKTAKQKMQ